MRCPKRALAGVLTALVLGLFIPPVEAAEDKITICHVPPGNPDARHTIRVGANAVPAHLAHGDSVGQCPTDCQLNASSCEDGNLCTDDLCLPDGQCSHRAVNCDDGNVCTQDLCVETVGCTYLPVSQPTQCDDGSACTASDTCMNGACKGTAVAGCCVSDADCGDENACTDDVCSGNSCSNPAVICRSEDKCVAAFCDPGEDGCSTAPVSCDDSNVCTDDFCDSVVGCSSVPTQTPPEPVETSCADNVDNDCDGAVDVADSDCSLTCSVGFSNCNGNTADGCECSTPFCCGSSCAVPHINGVDSTAHDVSPPLGQTYFHCNPLGIPGIASTYDITMAQAARAASPLVGTDFTVACVGGIGLNGGAREEANSCAVWVYDGVLAGHLRLSAVKIGGTFCQCPTDTTYATWQ